MLSERSKQVCGAGASPRCNGSVRTQMHRPSQRRHVWLPSIQAPNARLNSRQTSTVFRAAADTQQQASTSGQNSGGKEEFYEVYINKPLGVRFGRGNDGGAYITNLAKDKGNVDKQMQVGDKIVQVSASFGEDVWEAGNFGQCMYAIKTRNGELYFKMKKMNGDLSSFEEQEESDMEKKFKQERGGGNYGEGTKLLQETNYRKRKAMEAKREGLFESGLEKFEAKNIEGALFDFEEVIAMEIKQPVTAKDYSKTSSVYRVAHYNVACCYSALNQIDAGLDALSTSLQSGFDQFGKIRSDPNLEALRSSPRFQQLIDSYDEPVLDTSLFKNLNLGGLFGGGKKN